MKKTKIMFHGERVNWQGKIYQLFKDKNGEEHSFIGVKHIWFGAIYEMVNNKLSSRPKEVEVEYWQPTPTEEKEYEAQKLVVAECRQRRKKEMKIKKPREEIVRAVNLLRPFYLALSDTDRRRFIGWISNECSKKGKR